MLGIKNTSLTKTLLFIQERSDGLLSETKHAYFTTSLMEEREGRNMELILKVEEFRPDILKIKEMGFVEGVQYLFRFQNNYGASVIKTINSYGHEMDLWELAVVKFIDESDCYTLNYSTSITNDVLGYLTDTEVRQYLQKIKEL